MNTRSRFAFLALILTQAAHSIEEYVFRLYEVWAPARFVSRLLSNDLATGFIIFNAALVLFGLWCYLARVRKGHGPIRGWVWVWIVIESVNAIGHSVISLAQGAYFPGVGTAPLLLVLSIYLAVQIRKPKQHDRRADHKQHDC